MGDNFKYYIKVFLPNKVLPLKCKHWEKIESGVRLRGVEGYKNDVFIYNAGFIVSEELPKRELRAFSI